MELRIFEYFLAIAQEGSITGAARRLHVTQPTLSRQMKELEAELGRELLVRHSHNVSLTRDGEEFRRNAEMIVEMVNRTREQFSGEGDDPIGDVYVACAETAYLLRVAAAVDAFHRRYPRSRVHFTSGNNEDALRRLDDGTIDIAILAPYAGRHKYHNIPLDATEGWGLFVRDDHPLAAKDAIVVEDILEEPLVVPNQAVDRYIGDNPLALWFGDRLAEARIVATFNVPFAGRMLVKAGTASMITWANHANSINMEGMAMIPLKDAPRDNLVAATKKGVQPSRAAQAFLPYLKKA